MKAIKIAIAGLLFFMGLKDISAQTAWNDTMMVTFLDFRVVDSKVKFQLGIQPEDNQGQLASYSGVGMSVFNDTIMFNIFNRLFGGEIQSPEGMLNQRVRADMTIRVPNGITLDNGIKRGRLTFISEENETLNELGTFGVRMKLTKD